MWTLSIVSPFRTWYFLHSIDWFLLVILDCLDTHTSPTPHPHHTHITPPPHRRVVYVYFSWFVYFSYVYLLILLTVSSIMTYLNPAIVFCWCNVYLWVCVCLFTATFFVVINELVCGSHQLPSVIPPMPMRPVIENCLIYILITI